VLAAADIVSIWELGSHRPDWSKALIALGAALPEARPSELAEMTVGERNAHLLALRKNVIGPVMQASVKCPACTEPLEFEQSIDELLESYAPPAEREFAFAANDYSARYRLLDSGDLAHAAACGAEPGARQALAGRALLEVSRAGEAIEVPDLPDEISEALSKEMAGRDPLAHIAIPLACFACGHVWSATLQIVPFLWLELERKAKQLLEDVVAIARAYGWSEAEILAMGPDRRQYYLDSIG
jgi:hypothetical protein